MSEGVVCRIRCGLFVVLAFALAGCGPAAIATGLSSLKPSSGISFLPLDRLRPPELSAVPGAVDRIDLNWNDVDNETGYSIERKLAANGDQSFQRIQALDAGVTTFGDSGLAPGRYSYRMQSINAEGQSVFSNVVTTTTEVQTTLLEPVGGEVVVPGAAPVPEVRWQTSIASDAVRIEISPDSGGAFLGAFEVEDTGRVGWPVVLGELGLRGVQLEDAMTYRLRLTPVTGASVGVAAESVADFEIYQFQQPVLYDVDFAGMTAGQPPPPRNGARPTITTVDVRTGDTVVVASAVGGLSQAILIDDTNGSAADTVVLDLSRAAPSSLHQASAYRFEFTIVVDQLSGSSQNTLFARAVGGPQGTSQLFEMSVRRAGSVSQPSARIEVNGPVGDLALQVPMQVTIEYHQFPASLDLEVRQGATVLTRSAAAPINTLTAFELGVDQGSSARAFIDDIRITILEP